MFEYKFDEDPSTIIPSVLVEERNELQRISGILSRFGMIRINSFDDIDDGYQVMIIKRDDIFKNYLGVYKSGEGVLQLKPGGLSRIFSGKRSIAVDSVDFSEWEVYAASGYFENFASIKPYL